MRKEKNNFSDSSSLGLHKDDNKKVSCQTLHNQKSQLEINIDVLLGELSEIKAEYGISQTKQQDQEHFNLLEGGSSVKYAQKESQEVTETSEIAFQGIEQLDGEVEEEVF